MNNINISTTLKDLKKYIYAIICISISVGCLYIAYLFKTEKKEYTVEATYIITSTNTDDPVKTLSLTRNVASVFSKIVSGNEMKNIILKDIGGNSLGGYITANAIQETNLLQIKVTSENVRRAYSIIQSILNNKDVILEYLSNNISMNMIIMPNLTNTEQKKTIWVIPVMFVTFVILVALLVFYSNNRKTIKNEEDIKQKLHCHCLGSLPHEKQFQKRIIGRKNFIPKIITRQSVSFKYTESIHKLTKKIRDKMQGNVLMITSTSPNEGKSTVAANIALSLSLSGKDVLLMDLDLRNPTQYKIFGINEKIQELTEYLKGEEPQKLIRILKRENICVIFNTIPCADSTELLTGNKIIELINYLKTKFDYIIIDTPPITNTADADILSGIADSSVLIIKEHERSIIEISEVVTFLSESHAKLLGCVLNDTQITANEKYGYGYGYGYEKYGYGYGYKKR